MPSPIDDDLGFIGTPLNGGAPNVDSDALYADELDSYGKFDGEAQDSYERRVRHAFLVRELQQIDAIVDSRKKFANKIYWLVVAWLVGLAIVLFLSGWGYKGFDLDDKILLALIGGTTLNVLGIFTIVTNFLFPKSGASIFSQTAGALMHPLRTKAAPRKKPKEKEPANSTAA